MIEGLGFRTFREDAVRFFAGEVPPRSNRDVLLLDNLDKRPIDEQIALVLMDHRLRNPAQPVIVVISAELALSATNARLASQYGRPPAILGAIPVAARGRPNADGISIAASLIRKRLGEGWHETFHGAALHRIAVLSGGNPGAIMRLARESLQVGQLPVTAELVDAVAIRKGIALSRGLSSMQHSVISAAEKGGIIDASFVHDMKVFLDLVSDNILRVNVDDQGIWYRRDPLVELRTSGTKESEVKANGTASDLSIESLSLTNIKGFENIEFDLHDDVTLVVGENATGKTTILRCLALALLGPALANTVESDASSYLRAGTATGIIRVRVRVEGHDNPLTIDLEIREGESGFRGSADADQIDEIRRHTRDRFGFLCGYGAIRSFTDSSILQENPKEAIDRVASLFQPHAPVVDSELLSRMTRGDFSNLRRQPNGNREEVAAKIREKLQTLVPEGVVSASGKIGLFGAELPLNRMSDGYASLLALFGHLIRHAVQATDGHGDPTEIHGIALIDEVDLHLHPSWQRRILPDLRKVFPNLQIIATTHSPMVAGSSDHKIIALTREGDHVKPLTDFPSIKNWRADQILMSSIFGLPTTRSTEAQEKFEEYAELLAEKGPDAPEVRAMGPEVAQAMQIESTGVIDSEAFVIAQEVMARRAAQLSDEQKRQVLARVGLTLSKKV